MQRSTIILDLCLRKSQSRKSHDYRDTIVFEKLRFQCFSPTRKRKAGVFKFLRFQERLRKVPFSWQITADGRPNVTVEMKSFGVVWTLPKLAYRLAYAVRFAWQELLTSKSWSTASFTSVGANNVFSCPASALGLGPHTEGLWEEYQIINTVKFPCLLGRNILHRMIIRIRKPIFP